MIQFENAVNYFKKIILDELNEQNIKCWIAGGAVRDYFMGKQINTDYDIFFPDEKNYNKTLEYCKKHNCKILYDSDNSTKVKLNNLTFDLIKIYFDSPEITINAFDMTVSMLAVDFNKVYHGTTTFIDLSKRQLIFNVINYPTSTVKRVLRYYTKGFRMCDGETLRLINAVKLEKTKVKNEDDENNDGTDFSDYGDFTGID